MASIILIIGSIAWIIGLVVSFLRSAKARREFNEIQEIVNILQWERALENHKKKYTIWYEIEPAVLGTTFLILVLLAVTLFWSIA